MQIQSNGRNELTITGNIKSIEDSSEIKKALQALQQAGARNVLLKVKDSFAMTSTVIGHLMKLVNIDKITISIVVGDYRLYELLEELSLIHLFNVRHVGSEQ